MKNIKVTTTKEILYGEEYRAIIFRRGDAILPIAIDAKDYKWEELGEHIERGLKYLSKLEKHNENKRAKRI